MLPAARAVWVYAGDVFYAWAGGIAIDAIPTIFVILLTLGRPEDEAERDEERRRAAARAAAQAPRPVARSGAWPCGGADDAGIVTGSRARET